MVTYTPSISFGNEGIRLMVCNVCAATVVHDPRDDGKLLDLHADWHAQRGESDA